MQNTSSDASGSVSASTMLAFACSHAQTQLLTGTRPLAYSRSPCWCFAADA
jgi:hypothetical protein